jgi:tRNA(Met) C34 N-acetyltransferase TmcA
MNYKKKRLTPKQFAINCRQKYDSKVADNLLRQNGLNPYTFSTMAVEVAQALIAAKVLKKNYSNFLTPTQIKLINKFNSKATNQKICNDLKPAVAYPILNLLTKIKRKAHKQKVQPTLTNR